MRRATFTWRRAKGTAAQRRGLPADDIQQDLQFEDKNKITENLPTEVRWSVAEGDLTLQQLMESRFGQVLGGGGGGSVRWDSVFDESKEMPSRQSEVPPHLRPHVPAASGHDQVLQRGPRCLQEPGLRRGALIDNASVHAARDTYSDYLLNELDDEIAKHVPDY